MTTNLFVGNQIQALILADVLRERARQEQLVLSQKFLHTLACTGGQLSPSDKLAVLGEEFGEVSRVVCESLGGHGVLDVNHLREELIQLAACCVAWCEALDNAPTI